MQREVHSLKTFILTNKKKKNKHIQEVRSDNKIKQKEGEIFKDKKQKVIDYIKKIQIVSEFGNCFFGRKSTKL